MARIAMLASLTVVIACSQSAPRPSGGYVVGEEVGEVLSFRSTNHGLRYGDGPFPFRAQLIGAIPHRLVGDWGDGTAMVSRSLTIDRRGRFRWEMHGCMGTTYWTGDARVNDGVLLLVPDLPDWSFGGGRLLDVVQRDGETLLKPRPRDAQDRALHPFARQPDEGS